MNVSKTHSTKKSSDTEMLQPTIKPYKTLLGNESYYPYFDSNSEQILQRYFILYKGNKYTAHASIKPKKYAHFTKIKICDYDGACIKVYSKDTTIIKHQSGRPVINRIQYEHTLHDYVDSDDSCNVNKLKKKHQIIVTGDKIIKQHKKNKTMP